MCARPLRVGLFVIGGETPAHLAMPDWPEIIDYCRHAEEIGINAIYLGDHLQMNFGPEATFDMWDQPTLLAGIAAATTAVEIGMLMACTAHRNPALLARMALTIDAMSGGRMRLGIGAGWHDHEFTTFGYPLDHRAGRFAEAITIISALIRTGQADLEGRWYQCREADISPLLTDHRIPLIASGKGDRMLQLVAEYADEWNRDFGPEGSLAELPRWRERVDAACLAAGRAPATLRRSATLRISLPGTEGFPPDWAAMSGSVEQIADGLALYADAGYAEVVCWVAPTDRAALDVFGRVLERLDDDHAA